MDAQINEFNDLLNSEDPESQSTHEEDEEEDSLSIIIVVSIVPIPNETPTFGSEEDSLTQSTRSSLTPSADGEDRVFSSAESSSSASSRSSSEATSSSGSSYDSDSSSVDSGSSFDSLDSDSDSDSDPEITANHPGQTTTDSGYGPSSPGPQNPGPNLGPSDPSPSHHAHPQILGKRRRGDSPEINDMSSKLKEEQPSGSFHQDYIASLRYRNDLPPPDMPPKFLDIPHEGLTRFLTPGFASNLARREEPNIDVDAEGGMPIDMVGIPGLHLGDESGKRKSLLIIRLAP